MSFRACARHLAIAVAAVIVVAPGVYAGHQFFGQQVGGVSIDAAGVVGQPDDKAKELLLNELRKTVKDAPGAMNVPTEIRKVSLKGLLAAVDDAHRNNLGQLPDEVRFLAGLQRIEYVLVYPEANDIVLAGPGEGWTIDEDANVVGITTGRPVLRFDDLLVAFRSVETARTEGISCSIDPTEKGLRNLQRVLGQIKSSGTDPRAAERQMRNAFGPQMVTFTGIPKTSHFARVLVAADYRMKRLAMELDQSPIHKLKSYVSLVKNSRASRTNPRWWLACDYEPVAKSEDNLVWQIRGPGVKAMTEDEIVSESGKRTATGKTSAAAVTWAEMMTANYEELSAEDKVFAKLRNLMDMCVAAAIIERHGLRDIAGCDLELLYDSSSDVEIQQWNEAKTIPPQFSFIKSRTGLVVTASGGIQVQSWETADNTQVVANVAKLHATAKGKTTSWWWN